jgi:hypothetical protein
MTGNRLDDDGAIFLDNKAQAITGLDTEMLPNFLWNRDLTLRGQGGRRHPKSPYIDINTLLQCKEQGYKRFFGGNQVVPSEKAVLVAAVDVAADDGYAFEP